MGKYNDGTKAARKALVERLHDAMVRSVAGTQRQPVSKIRWTTAGVQFPHRRDGAFSDQHCRKVLDDLKAAFRQRLKAAINLA